MTLKDRYVHDVPYVAGFTAELMPAWLDFVALVAGFAPPDHNGGFAWCDLGCGRGLTAIICAATHPGGVFHAVDASPQHIADAQAIAGSAGVRNLTLHATDFSDACDLVLPRFQYIVAHGVYSWIDGAAGSAFRRFIDRHLAPGGLVYVSYNAMPGWAADGPFQHLVGALAARQPGDSIARFQAAAGTIQDLKRAGAAALLASPMAASEWDKLKETLPPAYFAHEYLAPAWRPLYVDEVRAAMAGIGLAPVGSATLRENFDDFVLRREARDALAVIADPDLRELARDFFIFQRFRRDVYGRAPVPLDPDECRQRLFASSFALVKPTSLVTFSMTTRAGTVGFDNPVAHRIVARLAEGPSRLDACLDLGNSDQDVLANMIVLCCAGAVRPVAAAAIDVTRLNETVRDHVNPSAKVVNLALPCGTALRVDRDVVAGPGDGSETPAWRDFLARACLKKAAPDNARGALPR